MARVTVVDRQNHHVFPTAAVSGRYAALSAPDIAQPIRAILRKKPNLSVIMRRCGVLISGTRKVKLDGGELSYDYLRDRAGRTHRLFRPRRMEQFGAGL